MTIDIQKEILEAEDVEFEWTILDEPDYVKKVLEELWFKDFQVKTVLNFMAEGATVPFVARYKKDQTWNLNEDQIREVIDTKNKFEKLHKAKQTAVNWIEKLGKMTPELMENILKAKTLKEVEEIYKPYKSKKKTKAMIAIEKWFGVVADLIKQNISISNFPPKGERIEQEILWLLEKYSKEEILEWAKYIIAAEVASNSDLRAYLLETLQKYWNIVSKIKTEKALEKLNDKDKAQIPKFDIYSDFSQRIAFLKPYQILALNRWEDIWILNVKIEKTDKTFEWLKMHYARILKVKLPFVSELEEAFRQGYDTLFKSVENELRGLLTEKAEDEAIDTFKKNLSQLLMTKPEYGKKILAIDPGYTAGCKMAVLDELANPIKFDKIYLHKKQEAISKLKDIIEKEKPSIIVVWNGTWVNETLEILHDITDLDIYIVNESWASVYSASKIAQEEFPDLDSLDRGTVSIWRRFIDPLSELVKVPVWSIWVWMYQHDMPEKKLEEKLGYVVEDTVNEVGINVNTASIYVLNHISWIDKRLAKKIYKNRPYKTREDLKKILSDKAYEQAIWFLRIPESPVKYDNSDIHPLQYKLAEFIEKNINNINSPKEFFEENKEKILELYSEAWINTIEFIIKSLQEIWKEKRVNSAHQKSTKKWSVEIKEGDIVDWVIRNVVAFGAFVDIWMKNDWLVHVSQIADKFVSDPREEIEVWQKVKVKVIWIDEKTGKIQLSMKEVN